MRALTSSAAAVVAIGIAVAWASTRSEKGAPAAGGTPRLVLVSSITLQETDSHFVGRPIGFAVSRTGRIYISDLLNSAVLEFSPAGRYVRSIGHLGQGPGEFTSVGFIALHGDTGLVVDGGAKLQFFDLREGKEKWARLAPAKMIRDIVVDGARIAMSATVGRPAGARASVVYVQEQNDSGVYGGPFPKPLGAHPAIDQAFGALQLAPMGGDSVAVAVAANSDYVFFGTYVAGPYDSIGVERRFRRGSVPPSTIEKVIKSPNAVSVRDLFDPSVPYALGRLTPGTFGYVVFDPELRNNRVVGRLYVSVVDWPKRHSCAESPVPVPTDPQPRAYFSGDTLMVLSQEDAESGGTQTVVRKFLIDTASCLWSAGRR